MAHRIASVICCGCKRKHRLAQTHYFGEPTFYIVCHDCETINACESDPNAATPVLLAEAVDVVPVAFKGIIA